MDHDALVFDTSVLFNLGHRDHLAWLVERLAERHTLLVPATVLRELQPERTMDYEWFCKRHFEIVAPDFSGVEVSVLQAWRERLDPGELEVLVVARARKATAVIDERKARAMATAAGIAKIGTLRLIADAVSHGWCDNATAFAACDELVANKFRCPAREPGHTTFAAYIASIKRR